MERTQIIRPAKKIKVVGCANCPYMKDKNVDGNCVANCMHPSFPQSTPPVTEHLDVIMSHQRTPDWCPLENDVEAVVITNPVCGCGFNN